MKNRIWFYILAGASIALCAVCCAVSLYHAGYTIYAIVTLAREHHFVTIPEQTQWAIRFFLRSIGSAATIVCLIFLSSHIMGKKASIDDDISYEEYCKNRMEHSAQKKEKKRKRLEEKLNQMSR